MNKKLFITLAGIVLLATAGAVGYKLGALSTSVTNAPKPETTETSETDKDGSDDINSDTATADEDLHKLFVKAEYWVCDYEERAEEAVRNNGDVRMGISEVASEMEECLNTLEAKKSRMTPQQRDQLSELEKRAAKADEAIEEATRYN